MTRSPSPGRAPQGAVPAVPTGSLDSTADLTMVAVPTPHPLFSKRIIAVTDAGQTVQRSYLIRVPLKFPKVVMPAVIAFHGGGQTASKMVEHWTSVAAQDIVIVCPEALVDPAVHETRWNVPRPGDTAWPTTDLAFVDALLQHLGATGDVDLNRVYAAGFSSGAAMTWQLTLHDDFVDRFRGFAPVSQAFNSAMLALAHPAARHTPKPVIYMHGTADDNWVRFHDETLEPMPPDVVAEWIKRNRSMAAGTPQVYASTPAEMPLAPIGLEQLYPPNPVVPGSTAVCFITEVNTGHCFPLTGRDPTGRGLVCRDFDATKRMLAFWTSYAGMGLPFLAPWSGAAWR